MLYLKTISTPIKGCFFVMHDLSTVYPQIDLWLCGEEWNRIQEKWEIVVYNTNYELFTKLRT